PSRMRALRLPLVFASVVAIVAAVALGGIAIPRSEPSPGVPASAGPDLGESASEPEAAGETGEDEGQEWEDGYFDPRKEAKFERTTGEADRKGPSNPAAEQVDN